MYALKLTHCLLAATVLVLALSLVACRGSDENMSALASTSTSAVTAVTQSAPRQQPVKPPPPRYIAVNSASAPKFLPGPGTGAGAQPAPAFRGFATVGVPVCDNLAKSVIQCVNTKGRDNQTASHLHGAFAGKVVAWRKAKAKGASDAYLAQQCSMYRTSVASTYDALGCAKFR